MSDQELPKTETITPENPHFGEKPDVSDVVNDVNFQIDDIKTWISQAIQESQTGEELKVTLRNILKKVDEIKNMIGSLK